MVTQNRVPAPKPVSCPNCGGRIELRGFAHTRSAVCLQCCTVLDTATPELRILQRFDERLRVRPLIPLGTRGQIQGKKWEVIGFQVRTIQVEGTSYSWHEYLLFNPYAGFRYLTHYDGHWNFVATLRALPEFTSAQGRKAVRFEGRTYRHFQSAQAVTTFVMGEFPWAVRVGEAVKADDYVAPPYVLSAEHDGREINWSQGVYMEGSEVWKAFALPGAPPAAHGVYANQPNPHLERMRRAWRTFTVLGVLWVAALVAHLALSANRELFRGSYRFSASSPGEHSLVTDVFTVPREGNVKIEIRTDLDNNWAYFNMALLAEDGSRGFDFGREISYYHGRDPDGSWSEGSRSDSATLARVPAGRYYLRIEPEMDAQASFGSSAGMNMNYEVIVRHDVPRLWLFFLALPLLLIPPALSSLRALGVESARWSESDYGTIPGYSAD
ncbi:MAG: DUF4178 domain-containing protein [Bryobacteraceae bacterium]|nr:DUF4178 domain-containing protein [Bryobacteraceae bacterium]